MTHYAKGLVVRDGSNKPHPDRWATGAFGELFIDDGTGFVSASDATAEIIDASPVMVGRLLHVTAVAAERAASTDGRLTVQLPGDYEVKASGSIALAGAADTFKVEVYVNGAVIADAVATPGGEISAHSVAVGTGVQGWSLNGTIPDMEVGDYVDLRVTTTGTTTATIKQMRFNITLVGDNSEPGEPTT